METGKCSGKAVGTVVAVFQGCVDDLHIAGSQLTARQRQPAVLSLLYFVFSFCKLVHEFQGRLSALSIS